MYGGQTEGGGEYSAAFIEAGDIIFPAVGDRRGNFWRPLAAREGEGSRITQRGGVRRFTKGISGKPVLV